LRFRAARIQERPLTSADIKLVIEVADSSWDYDVNQKAAKYAAFGVGEYWGLHAVTRQARLHRIPGPGAWAHVRDLSPPAMLELLCAPGQRFEL